MKMHDKAMSDHEEHGKGDQHNHLKSEHTEIMKHHAEFKKKMDSSASHHKGLIKGILEFSKKHMKEFHGHDHSGHDHSDHDHSDHDH